MKKRAASGTAAPHRRATSRAEEVVMTLNGGSSSLKFALLKHG